jgi:hypothetical protein
MQELADRLMAQNPEGLKKVLAGLSSRARSLVQSMASQIQQLQQQLQQVTQDLKLGLTKTHMETTVKAHDIEEDNATRRADAELRHRTALAVEEIRAGGKILDTHAKAGHEARAQERMIEAGEAAEKSNGAA